MEVKVEKYGIDIKLKDELLRRGLVDSEEEALEKVASGTAQTLVDSAGGRDGEESSEDNTVRRRSNGPVSPDGGNNE